MFLTEAVSALVSNKRPNFKSNGDFFSNSFYEKNNFVFAFILKQIFNVDISAVCNSMPRKNISC